MAITTTYSYEVDLKKGAEKISLPDPLATLDSQAHIFTMTVLEGGKAASISSAKCTGWFIRGDGVTVPLTGTISGNTASVTLAPNCYAVSGRFRLAVKLESGSVIHTLLQVDGFVDVSRTDKMTSAGSGVQSFDNLVNTVYGVSNRDRVANLLDNSNFINPVNQRGNTSYNGTGYGIDRWRTNFSADTVGVTATGVKNTVASTASGWHLHQVLPDVSFLVGKTVTAACFVKAFSGSLYLLLSFRDANDNELSHKSAKIASGLVVASETVPTGTVNIRVGLYAYDGVASGDYATLQWAALYEGSYNTESLPAYQPKEYAVELAACRRYYKRYSSAGSTYEVCLSGYFTGSGKDIVVGIPGNMRGKPTVTVNGSIAVRDSNGYVVDLTTGYANPQAIASGNWDTDWATIYFRNNEDTAWGGTNNTLCNVCLLKGGELILSAEL